VDLDSCGVQLMWIWINGDLESCVLVIREHIIIGSRHDDCRVLSVKRHVLDFEL
jgi:hypothetical protein